MLKSGFWKIVPILLIVYVGFGDKFLPPNLGQYSALTRQKLSNYLVSLFPKKDIDSPYGRNEEIIQQMENSNNK